MSNSYISFKDLLLDMPQEAMYYIKHMFSDAAASGRLKTAELTEVFTYPKWTDYRQEYRQVRTQNYMILQDPAFENWLSEIKEEIERTPGDVLRVLGNVDRQFEARGILNGDKFESIRLLVTTYQEDFTRLSEWSSKQKKRGSRILGVYLLKRILSGEVPSKAQVPSKREVSLPKDTVRFTIDKEYLGHIKDFRTMNQKGVSRRLGVIISEFLDEYGQQDIDPDELFETLQKEVQELKTQKKAISA